MASIDKIYGTYYQWVEFHQWVALSQRPQYCKYFYPTPPYGEDGKQEGPITNMGGNADQWLWDNCPIKWVKKRLKEQYNGKRPT